MTEGRGKAFEEWWSTPRETPMKIIGLDAAKAAWDYKEAELQRKDEELAKALAWLPIFEETEAILKEDNEKAERRYESQMRVGVEMQLRLDAQEAELQRKGDAWKAARATLPPDPDLNAPWSQCIAIMDEALKEPITEQDIAESDFPPPGENNR